MLISETVERLQFELIRLFLNSKDELNFINNMEIQDIKQQLTIRMVLDHYNIKPDATVKTGWANSMIHCPFHDDKTPSMQVYDKTNTAFCFSANCKLHGKSIDVIDFVKYKEFDKLSAAEAKHQALKKCISLISSAAIASPIVSVAPSPTTNKSEQHRIDILTRLFTYFKNSVATSPGAKNYLENRSLDHHKIEIGYNAASFHYQSKIAKTENETVLLEANKKHAQLIHDYVSYGLLLDKGLTARTGAKAYQVFAKNCICFALKNNNNQIVSLYFRSIQDVTSSSLPRSSGGGGEMRHYYLKDRQGLYPCYPAKSTMKLIITESIIDAATLLQSAAITSEYGILACYGTNGLTEEHINAIKLLSNLSEIVFAFDNDDAGVAATAKYAKQLKKVTSSLPLGEVEMSTLSLPCKDVNETIQAHNDDTILIQLLKERLPLIATPMVDNNKNISSSAPTLSAVEVSPVVVGNLGEGLNSSNPNKLIYKSTTATYCIMGGLPKLLDNLKVMLQVENERGFKSRNKIDLYEDKQVEKISKDIAEKLLLNQSMLEQDLYTLTEALENHRDALSNAAANDETEHSTKILSIEERTAAVRFLQQDKTIKKLNELLAKTGIVGEERNRIFLFLIALSYKMKDPLHALVQGSSGSGKTKIVRQISDCMPTEKVTRFTRISDKALYNFPQYYFKNRLLIIEDVDGLSEEAELSFRELQSSGELRSGMSIKQENGSITGGAKIVNGPIASMSCTTKGEVYEDNMSRVFLIAVDESLEQTKRIIQYQNKIASGVINTEEQKRATSFVQNIIRVIEAKPVINPFAEKIHLPEEAHKIRRLNDLFQNFIKMVTLINQYKRQSTKYNQLIAEIEDVEIAIEIMFESIVLKVDELDGSLRQFYERLKTYLKKNYPKLDYSQIQFSQREIRQSLNLSKAQINRYLQSLVDLEYMAAYGHSNKGFKYKVQYWDDYEALRKKIKDHLSKQIETLKLKAAS
jgi:DNA primase